MTRAKLSQGFRGTSSSVSRRTAVATALFGAAFASNALATTYVAEGNVTWKDVPEAETAEDSVQTGANGLLYKTGAGVWTLSPSYLSGTTLPLAIRVLQGSLAFDGATLPAASTAAPDAAQEAYLWFDASRAATLLDTNGAAVASGALATWCDARETTPGTTAERGFAKAMFNMPDHTRSDATALAPDVTTYGGKAAVYFGGTTSGRWMQWCTPSGADAADTVPIKNIFAVHAVTASYGWLFGSTSSGTRTFHPPAYGSATSWGRYWASGEPSFTDEMYSARTYLDGERIDGFNTSPKAGIQLIEVDFARGHGRANNFFNDNNCGASANYRQGGDYLCEVLVFTNALSDAARMQVESYLLAKWCATSRPAQVALAPGASLAFTASGAKTLREIPNGLTVSGEGTVSVAGSGEVALPRSVTDRTDGVTVRPAAGATVIADRPVAVAAQAGETIGAVVRYGGEGVTLSAGAEADEIVKTGEQEVSLAGVPADLRKLSVTGGTLRLNGVRSASAEGSASDAVTIENGSFEAGDSAADNHRFGDGETFQGWTSRLLRTGYCDYCSTILCNGQYPNSGYMFLGTPPDGTHCMMFSMNVEASTPVTLNRAGVYEVSFWIGGRNSESYSNGYQQDVFLTSGDETVITNFAGRSISASCTAFSSSSFLDLRFHFRVVRFRVPAAGTYRLCFAPSLDYGTKDLEALLDDVRMRRIPEAEEEPDAWPLPNGDFERASFTTHGTGSPVQFGKAASVPGWTVTHPDANVSSGGFATRMMTTGGRCRPYYNDSRYPAGGEVMFLAETNGTLATTFRPPKGCWRLRAATARRGWNGSSLSVAATVRMGSKETALGTISPALQQFNATDWPTSFEADGETDVTLTLDCLFGADSTMYRNGIWLDDFRLVPASSVSGPELVTDGSFESGSGWTFTVAEHGKENSCQRDDLLNRTKTDGKHWGYDPPDGTYAALITQDAKVSRTVTFPEAGHYRLSIMARCRADYEYGGGIYGGYWRHPVRVELEKSGVIREIGSYRANSSNFVHYAWNFRVPEAGDYTLRFQGVAEESNGYRMSFVDTVSVCAAPAEDAPDLPQELRVSVAEGAKLHLDFSGTGTVARVRLGGHARSGVVSSETDPDYVTGPGCLAVLPRGFRVIVR